MKVLSHLFLSEHLQAWAQEDRLYSQQQRVRVHFQLRIHRDGRRRQDQRSMPVLLIFETTYVRTYIHIGLLSVSSFVGRYARPRHNPHSEATEAPHRTGARKTVSARRVGEQRRAISAG